MDKAVESGQVSSDGKSSGDEWSRILNHHSRWLRAVLYVRVRRADVVDELMQEIAVALSKNGRLPHEPAAAAAWLYRTAVRQALLYLRRKGREERRERKAAEVLREVEEKASTNYDPLSWLLADERRSILREALAALPPKDAEILLLKYGEDWSYARLVAHLGLSPEAVQSRLHRARERLRAQLARITAQRPSGCPNRKSKTKITGLHPVSPPPLSAKGEPIIREDCLQVKTPEASGD